jgi:hypothetical protein
MKITRSQEWLRLVGLASAGVLVFAGVYALALRFIAPAKDVRDYYAGVIHFLDERAPDRAGDAPPAGMAGFVTLKVDRAAAVGRTRLIYRGRRPGNRFAVDVVVPDLDPDAAYPHVLDVPEAKIKFTLGGRNFRLLNVTANYLHLQELP